MSDDPSSTGKKHPDVSELRALLHSIKANTTTSGPDEIYNMMPAPIMDWINNKDKRTNDVAGLSKPSLDKATGILNGLLFEAKVQLDTTLINCAAYKTKYIEDLNGIEHYQAFLSGEIGVLSGDAMQAGQQIPQLEDKIKALRKRVEANELRCQRLVAETNNKLRMLQGDEAAMSAFRATLNCGASKSLLQVPAANNNVSSIAEGFFAECGRSASCQGGITSASGSNEEKEEAAEPTIFLFDEGVPPKAGLPQPGLALSVLTSRLSSLSLGTAVRRALLGARVLSPAQEVPEQQQLHVVGSSELRHGLLAELQVSAGIRPQELVALAVGKDSGEILEDGTAHALRGTHNKVQDKDKEEETEKKKSDQPKEKPCGCVMRTFRCGETEDSIGQLAGQVSDQLDELEIEIARNKADCEEKNTELETDIENLVSLQATANEHIMEASASQTPLRAEMGMKKREMVELKKLFQEEWAGCKEKVHDLSVTRICGLKKVRDGLRMSFGLLPTPRDCVVSEWVAGECSFSGLKQCGLNKGTRTLTRRVLYPPRFDGTPCPPLQMLSPCGDLCPQDCKVGDWSGWSKCTAECNGGSQTRTRNVKLPARNGGKPCEPTMNSRTCGNDPCDRDCELHDWSFWSSCTKACGGGRQARRRKIKVPVKGQGTCAHPEDRTRFEEQVCNADQPCPENPVCVTPTDLAILVDASGSISPSQFEATKALTKALAAKFRLNTKSSKGSRVGVLSFSDEGNILVPLTEDPTKLQAGIDEKLTWLGGFTMAGAGLVRAKDALMNGGRTWAKSVVVVLTDGKISYKFKASKAAQDLRDENVRVVFVPIQKMFKDYEILQPFVSDPAGENIMPVDGAEYLADHVDSEARSVLLELCPKVLPAAMAAKEGSTKKPAK